MPSRRWTIIACLFLVLATLTVYGGLRNHQFINFDDDLYITDNPPVQGGLTLTGLGWAFTTLHAGLWIPLTWLSFMVDSQLFGLRAGGFLLTNLLFHIANALLLFWWLRRTTRALGIGWPNSRVAFTSDRSGGDGWERPTSVLSAGWGTPSVLETASMRRWLDSFHPIRTRPSLGFETRPSGRY